ncbi:MAG TPA: hemerythrin domain-containing protein [Gemmatimonadaceae bacterium]|nr:hemerythrin domain-containing protein [Gemmatimonadaceae bacterium]
MRQMNILNGRALLGGLAVVALLCVPALRAQDAAAGARTVQGLLQIPPSVRAEHREIHEALVAATRAPGEVGVAARALAAVLDPHFVREEQIALPPLGLLAPLARGERPPAMRAVLPLTDSLRAELPRMLREHQAIHAATLRLQQVARARRNAQVERLTDELLLHARNEEEVMYPAALLVGEVVRAQLPPANSRR